MGSAEPINFWRRALKPIFGKIQHEYKENSGFDIKRQKFTLLNGVSHPSIRNPNATTEFSKKVDTYHRSRQIVVCKVYLKLNS